MLSKQPSRGPTPQRTTGQLFSGQPRGRGSQKEVKVIFTFITPASHETHETHTSHFPCHTLYTRTDNDCDCVVVKAATPVVLTIQINKHTNTHFIFPIRQDASVLRSKLPHLSFLKAWGSFLPQRPRLRQSSPNLYFLRTFASSNHHQTCTSSWATMDSNMSKLTRSKHKKTKHKQTPQHDDYCANHSALVIINTTRLFEAVVVTSTHPYQATTCL